MSNCSKYKNFKFLLTVRSDSINKDPKRVLTDAGYALKLIQARAKNVKIDHLLVANSTLEDTDDYKFLIIFNENMHPVDKNYFMQDKYIGCDCLKQYMLNVISSSNKDPEQSFVNHINSMDYSLPFSDD